MEESSKISSPHVLIFPFPAQGHINSMLKLAELFSLSGISVTFLNTEHSHESLERFTDLEARFLKYPGFQFVKIPDCLKFDQVDAVTLIEAMKFRGNPLIEKLLTESNPQINCIIVDGILGFAADIASKLGIPVIYFRTVSACAIWSYFCIPDMIDAGELPIKGEEDMDTLVTKVPGMETFLRKRDLPSLCRAKDMSEPNFSMLVKETRQTTRAQAFILNTFEDLESPILSQIRDNICPKTYTIGPIHELLKTIKTRSTNSQESSHSSNSILEVDWTCIDWLDKQPSHSVVYVSFGSGTKLTIDQLTEFWHGLVNSKMGYLWVIRRNSITDQEGIVIANLPEEFQEGCKENGYIVGWAPQEEVLAHRAVGGFLTHNGWNSTLESIVAGVPMICWPYFVDQQINSRFVDRIWNLGFDMKDVCDRRVVVEMVNDLMVNWRDDYVRSASRMARLAEKSVIEGGSSYCNLYRLIEDIKMMRVQKHQD